jgi:hypothetical protein
MQQNEAAGLNRLIFLHAVRHSHYQTQNMLLLINDEYKAEVGAPIQQSNLGQLNMESWRKPRPETPKLRNSAI